jgi:flagella basal body P-ring formation protein FlgA
MSAAVLVAAACVSLAGPNITAGDLAKALPGFTPADPAAVVALSPVPGVTRTFQPADVAIVLKRLSAQVQVPQKNICFERVVSPLSESAVLKAMRTALGEDSKIEILEISRFPVPEGEIVFQRTSLGASPETIWHGFVRYDRDRKFPIWARVRVRMVVTRIIAVDTLIAGAPIQVSQLKLEKSEVTANSRIAYSSFDQVEGYLPRRTIPANSPVWKDSIEPPKEVLKGDRVTLTVRSGPTLLTVALDAETSGRRGEFVSLKNPLSGKMFRARVEGPKTVSIDLTPAKP